MIRVNRTLGGLLASTGGLVLIMSIWAWAFSGPGSQGNPYNMLMNLILGSLGLTGGILLACDVKIGGILAIIAGGAALFFAFIPDMSGISSGYWLLPWNGWDFFYLEIILLIVGGIIGTPSGHD
jgi:hypothetical protein